MNKLEAILATRTTVPGTFRLIQVNQEGHVSGEFVELPDYFVKAAGDDEPPCKEVFERIAGFCESYKAQSPYGCVLFSCGTEFPTKQDRVLHLLLSRFVHCYDHLKVMINSAEGNVLSYMKYEEHYGVIAAASALPVGILVIELG